ncbi:complement C3-like isoform X2 [Ascaphus truei]|uniref:complement C3-like isoform X2 n=1 Tax=Ascaphus truei TaxID=8439 RepID=UPI003F5A7398
MQFRVGVLVETKVNKDFVVKATGKGQGTLTVMSVYYGLLSEKETKCNNFNLSVTVKDEPFAKAPEGAKSTVNITICARHLRSFDSTMSILDVSMMTGFSPDIDELNKLTNGVDRYISKFEMNKEATDKGTLIIYLNKISHKEDECLKVMAHQFFEVGLIQPASVTVYDYYSPESRCTKFYHMEEGSNLLGKICQAEVCRCAEENCFMQQPIGVVITAKLRLEMACLSGVDYVYKATLTGMQTSESFDNYVMTIQQVIKEDTDVAPLGNKRNFISHIKCHKSLKLKIGRDYLIWGVTSDLWNQPSGFAYIIGKETWIEWWPNEGECQDPEHRNICDDFFEFSDNLDQVGCPT